MINAKPKLFIGSASESLPLVEALEFRLRNDVVTEVWNQSFRPGYYTLEELVNKAKEVDFAVFVLGDEDKTESRGSTIISPRDNVVYEAGLFAGHLDIRRVFLLVAKGTKVPSDWKGLGCLEYDPGFEDANEEILNASIVIRKELNDWKKRVSSTFENQILGYWWQYVLNSDEGSVVCLLSIKRYDKTSSLKIGGETWTKDGKSIAKFSSRAMAYDHENRRIFYYWDGEHPFDKRLPRFIGVGEIQFDEESRGRGAGWFSSTPLDQVDATTRNATKYVRASEEEVAIMGGNNRDLMQQMVDSKCKEFMSNLLPPYDQK
jgi:hypothetical protein